MHFLLLAIARPATDSEVGSSPLTLDFLRKHLNGRLTALPWLRWRLERVPLGLHQPVLVDDPDFELDRHLCQIRLPHPGGVEQLDRLCELQASEHLDRGHALWTLTLVDGLRDDRQALLFRVHHCLMDGIAAAVSFASLFAGDGVGIDSQPTPWYPEPIPTRGRLVLRAIRDHIGALPDLPRTLRKLIRAFRLADRSRRSSLRLPKAGDAPYCSLNRGSTLDRRFLHLMLPLADVKQVKDVAGVSVNDVLLAVIAGAISRYLKSHEELPERPLLASVLVGLDGPSSPPRNTGNRISALTTSLATDIADPWERLQMIHLITSESKDVIEETGPELLARCLEFIPPWIAEPAVRQLHRSRIRHPERTDHNVTVSNFKGPRERWSLGGSIIEEAYFSGPPTLGDGINVSVWSYGDNLMVGILSSADSINSSNRLSQDFADALRELLSRSEERRTPAHTPS